MRPALLPVSQVALATPSTVAPWTPSTVAADEEDGGDTSIYEKGTHDDVTSARRKRTAIDEELPETPRPEAEDDGAGDASVDRYLKVFISHLDRRLDAWHLKHQDWLQNELPVQLSMAMAPTSTRLQSPRATFGLQSPRDSPRGQYCPRSLPQPRTPPIGVVDSVRSTPCDTICETSGDVVECDRAPIDDKAAQKTRQMNLARKLMNVNPDEAIIQGRNCVELIRSGNYEILMHHPCFKVGMSSLIIAYAVMLAVIIEMDCQRGKFDDTGVSFVMMELLFGFIFFPELISRLLLALTYREHVCIYFGRPWNVFDMVMFTLQVADFLFLIYTSGYTIKSGASGLRQAMMVFRVARVVRLLRFWPSLEAPAKLVLLSLWSVRWLILASLQLFFVFCILITSVAFQHLQANDGDIEDLRKLRRYFGDLPTTGYTLYLSVTNGMHSKVCLDTLFAVQPLLAVVYVVFLLTVSFVIFNVFTGIVVEKIATQSSEDRDKLVAQQRNKLEIICLKLLDALHAVGEEEGGDNVCLEELLSAAEDAHFSQHLKALQIGENDTRKIVHALDRDRKGGINAKDFVDGCLKVKSGMRNADLHLLLFETQVENKRIHKEIQREVRASAEQVKHQMRLLLMRMMHTPLAQSALHSPQPPVVVPNTPVVSNVAHPDWPFEVEHTGYVSAFSPRRFLLPNQEEILVPPDMHDVPWMKSRPPKGLSKPRNSPRCSPRESLTSSKA